MAQACVMSRPQQEQQQLFTPGKQPADNSLITSTVRKRKVVATDTPHLRPAGDADDGKRQRTPSMDRGLNDADAVVRLELQLASPAAALTAAAATPAALLPPPALSLGGGAIGGAMDAEGMERMERGQQQPGAWQHARCASQQHQGQQQAGIAHQHVQHHHEGRRASTPALAAEEERLFSPVFHLCHHSDSQQTAGPADAAAATASALPPLSPPPGLPPRPPLPPSAALTAPPAGPSGRADTDGGSNTSTDHSTGTSACLGTDGELSDGDAASADLAAAPPPLAPEGQAECGGMAADCEAAAVEAAAPGGCEEEGGDEYLEFDPLLFIKRLPPLERCVPPRREFLLPRKTRRSKQKTLVLDLDETLVHSTLDGYCRPDFTFPVEVGAMRHMVSVRQRPHLHTFLERVAQLYEVVVFTASQRVYAEQLLDIVDPGRRLVRHRVFRESCVFWEGNYLKDLTVLGRDLAHTIIVDNSPQAFGFQLDNGIPIESWYDDDADEELLKLLPFLESVAHADDVRPHIQDRFRLRHLVDSTADPEQPAVPLVTQALP